MEPYIIEPRFTIESGVINHVGEMLGFEWNAVCDLIQEEELYGMDGAGWVTVDRRHNFGNDLDKIFEKLFTDNPTCDTIYILDDF